MKNKIYDWRLTRQEEVIEIDVRSDRDLYLVVYTTHPTSGRTFSTCDDPLKYPSAETAKQYAEECIKLKLADGWVIAPSHAQR